MEPEGSLPHSQVLATCPYILGQINPVHVFPTAMKIHSAITFPSTPRSAKLSLSQQVSPPKTLYAPPLSPISFLSIWSPE